MAKVTEAACVAVADDLRRIADKCNNTAEHIGTTKQATYIYLACVKNCIRDLQNCADTMHRVLNVSELGV